MTVSLNHAQVSITSASSTVTNPAVVAMAMIRPTSPNSSSSDTENVAHSSSTALRRLYFKSARSSRTAKGPTVPKVSREILARKKLTVPNKLSDKIKLKMVKTFNVQSKSDNYCDNYGKVIRIAADVIL